MRRLDGHAVPRVDLDHLALFQGVLGGDGFALLFAGLQVLDRWPFGKNGGPIGAGCWVFS